jgi:hypothetical protein
MAMWKFNSFTAALLWFTTVFSYAHENYGTAVIVAGCAGLVTGMTFAQWARRRS